MILPRHSALLWAALAGALAVIAVAEPAWGQGQCSQFELVGKPTAMTRANGAPVYVEAPSFADTPNGLALVGTPTFFWWSSRTFLEKSIADALLFRQAASSVGVIRDANGVAIDLPRPDSGSSGQEFRILNVGRTPTMFWTTEPDSTRHWTMSGGILWGTQLVDGRWSKPSLVARASDIEWNPSSAAIVDIGGAPRIFVGASDSATRHSGVLSARPAGQGWETSWVETGLSPGYVAAVDDGAGNALVAVGSGMMLDESMNAINGIYLYHERDGKLGEPVLVHRVPTGAHLLKMGRTPDGDLHLVWMEKYDEGRAEIGAIRHLISRDNGSHWSDAQALDLHGDYIDLFVLARPDRPLLVASSDHEHQRVTVWTWRKAAWQRVVDLPGAAIARVTMAWTGDRVVVAWGEASPLAGTRESNQMWPMLVTAELLCR